MTRLILTLSLVSAGVVNAQEPTTAEKVEALEKEVEKLKAGKTLFKPAPEKGKYGLGPAASKVYDVDQGVSLGGYGEMVYKNPYRYNESGQDKIGKTDTADQLRLILYAGYKFNDWILLNTEIEFEHADEAFVEFAYVDFLFNPLINVRAGLLLSPMGFINELHEPPIFLGTNRPVTEQKIIPSTWRENGVGIFGEFADIEYKLYAMNSLDGTGSGAGSGFDGDNGLRGGRQKGSKASANDIGGVLRLDYTGINGFLVGASGFYGDTGQENLTANNEQLNGTLKIAEGHIEVKQWGLHFRLLGSYAWVSNALELSSSSDNSAVETDKTTGNQEPADYVGEELFGGYVELGYDIFRFFDINQELILFVRKEAVDTQRKIVTGGEKDQSNDQLITTVGLHYRPIINLAIKVDVELKENEAETGLSQFNAGIGYLF